MIVLPTDAHEAARGAVAGVDRRRAPSPARVAHLHLGDPASSDQVSQHAAIASISCSEPSMAIASNLLVLHREPRMMAAVGVQEDRTRGSLYSVVQ
jgi:hypothetical protein